MPTPTHHSWRMTPLRLAFGALVLSYIGLMIINIKTSNNTTLQTESSTIHEWKIEPTTRAARPVGHVKDSISKHDEGNLDKNLAKQKHKGHDQKPESKETKSLDDTVANSSPQVVVMKGTINNDNTNNNSHIKQQRSTGKKSVSKRNGAQHKNNTTRKVGFNFTESRKNATRLSKNRERPVPLRVTKEFANRVDDPLQLHKELKVFYTNFTTTTTTTTTANKNDNHYLWYNTTSYLPDWMKRYLTWHAHSRQRIANHPELYGEYRYFVLQCIRTEDHHCGGLSDRLKPIPWAIRNAYYTKRLVFIHWTRPGSLEEFLVPPKGGLDWRAPTWLAKRMEEDKYLGAKSLVEKEIRAFSRTNETLIRSRFQAFHAGMFWYDEQLVEGEHRAAEIFHEIWKITFTPSPAVKNAIEREMNKLGLVPGGYTAAHLRALYGIDDRAEGVKMTWAENALNCASELRPRTPIFFTSDSSNATYYAKVYAAEQNAEIRTRIPNPNPPLHIDKVKAYLNLPPSDYYDTFVDLYILAQADCVTYNKGGYGIFGLLIGRNFTCGVRQDAIDRPRIFKPCVWVDDPKNGTNVTREHYRPPGFPVSHDPVYLEPMTELAS